MSLDLDLIIEPEELEEVLGDPQLMVIDVCQPQTYAQIHVPGAIHVRPAELVSGEAPAPGKLPSVDQLKALFSRIGYSPDKHIVVYDDEGGGWAGRFIWTLDVIGHTRYSYLNGGLHAWYKEGHVVGSDQVQPEPGQVEVTVHPQVIAELQTVLDSLEDDSIRIWDARSAEEYSGEKQTALRPGHIPGAINLDWLDTMDRERNLRLLPLEQLRGKLDQLGITADKTIITHCQSHHRSGLTYLIAKALGQKALGYHGSWAEWGNRPDTPVEIRPLQS